MYHSWVVEYRDSQRWALSKGQAGMEGHKSLETELRSPAQLGNHAGNWSQGPEREVCRSLLCSLRLLASMASIRWPLDGTVGLITLNGLLLVPL